MEEENKNNTMLDNPDSRDLSNVMQDAPVKVIGELPKRAVAPDSKKSKMVIWVLKYSGGLIKDEQQVIYVLMAASLLAFIISGALLFGTFQKKISPTPPPPASLEQSRILPHTN